MLSTKHLNELRKLRLCILDDMTFVENAEVPIEILQAADIVSDYLVRGDDDVRCGKLKNELLLVSCGAYIKNRASVFGILEDLVVPMPSEIWRADYERWEMNSVEGLSLLVPLRPFALSKCFPARMQID